MPRFLRKFADYRRVDNSLSPALVLRHTNLHEAHSIALCLFNIIQPVSRSSKLFLSMNSVHTCRPYHTHYATRASYHLGVTAVTFLARNRSYGAPCSEFVCLLQINLSVCFWGFCVPHCATLLAITKNSVYYTYSQTLLYFTY